MPTFSFTRKPSERIVINHNIVVEVHHKTSDVAHLSIVAPDGVTVIADEDYSQWRGAPVTGLPENRIDSGTHRSIAAVVSELLARLRQEIGGALTEYELVELVVAAASSLAKQKITRVADSFDKTNEGSKWQCKDDLSISSGNKQSFNDAATNSVHQTLRIWGLFRACWNRDKSICQNAIEELRQLGPEAVSVLTGALRDSDADIRANAAWVLGEFGAGAVAGVKALAAALGDANGGVRSNAAWALGEFGAGAVGAIEVLVKARYDRDRRVAACANSALVRVGVAGAAVLVRESRTAKILMQIGPPIVPALVGVLRDNDADTQGDAAHLLGQFGPHAVSAVPGLIEALVSPAWRVRGLSAWALGRIKTGAAEAVPILLDALGSTSKWERAQAAEALVRIGPGGAEVVPRLINALGDESEEVANYLIKMLCQFGPQVVTELVKALDTPDEYMRWNVARTLAHLGQAAVQAVPALINAFEIPDSCGWKPDPHDPWPWMNDSGEEVDEPYVRARVAIVWALGQIGPHAATAMPTLLKAMRDPSDSLRAEATAALVQIGPLADHIDMLVAALDDPSSNVRWHSVSALAAIGRKAKVAVPKLKLLTQGCRRSDEAVRQEAARAIAVIGPESDLKATFPGPEAKLQQLLKAGGREWESMRGHLLAFRTLLEHTSCAAAAGERGQPGGGAKIRYHLAMLKKKLGAQFTCQRKQPEGLELTKAGTALREWLQLHAAEVEG